MIYIIGCLCALLYLQRNIQLCQLYAAQNASWTSLYIVCCRVHNFAGVYFCRIKASRPTWEFCFKNLGGPRLHYKKKNVLQNFLSLVHDFWGTFANCFDTERSPDEWWPWIGQRRGKISEQTFQWHPRHWKLIFCLCMLLFKTSQSPVNVLSCFVPRFRPAPYSKYWGCGVY